MPNTPEDNESDKRVTSSHGMRRVLEGLLTARSLITIIIGDQNRERYSSAVLAVYPDEQQFVMDEITPKKGHALLIEAKTLKAYALLKGVKVHFSVELRKADSKDGIYYYVFSYPEYIYYEQQRTHYRVHVPASRQKAVRLSKAQGRLIDLSVGGIGALFPIDSGLNEGDTISDVEVQLPDGNTLYCDLEICHIVPLEAQKKARIGARFINIPRDQKRRLQRCVTSLEREELRTLPKD
jgi:c-di-GMP-binding flagellar brake protein YcgR